MSARIFRPNKSATQSGMGRAKRWHLVYEPARPRGQDPLMGWTTSDDMNSQIRLTFDTKEEAIAYAERNAIPFVLEEPATHKRPTISYSDNFRPGRMGQWTH
ncbi:MAG: ETC complex I subunit [Methylobacteriaceae bacterium]|nr:ETC complex I subunit [Methylobacteriaceae bacterium]